MLRQASIGQIHRGELTKRDGYLVAAMRFYPRGLKRELLDEYRSDLAPDLELFRDFKKHQKAAGHEEAFNASRYEERFSLRRSAFEHLRVLADAAKSADVFLACQCEVRERCHREMLLLIARERFAASTAPLSHAYPILAERLASGDI